MNINAVIKKKKYRCKRFNTLTGFSMPKATIKYIAEQYLIDMFPKKSFTVKKEKKLRCGCFEVSVEDDDSGDLAFLAIEDSTKDLVLFGYGVLSSMDSDDVYKDRIVFETAVDSTDCAFGYYDKTKCELKFAPVTYDHIFFGERYIQLSTDNYERTFLDHNLDSVLPGVTYTSHPIYDYVALKNIETNLYDAVFNKYTEIMVFINPSKEVISISKHNIVAEEDGDGLWHMYGRDSGRDEEGYTGATSGAFGFPMLVMEKNGMKRILVGYDDRENNKFLTEEFVKDYAVFFWNQHHIISVYTENNKLRTFVLLTKRTKEIMEGFDSIILGDYFQKTPMDKIGSRNFTFTKDGNPYLVSSTNEPMVFDDAIEVRGRSYVVTDNGTVYHYDPRESLTDVTP